MAKGLALLLLLISLLSSATALGEISSLEIVPEYPSQGDAVSIRIAAQPEEEVSIIIAFSKTLSVVDGNYEWFLDDVYVPSTPNRVSVRAENVANVHLSVKIIFWITKSAAATDGVVTLSQSNVPKGTYDLRLHGDAVSDASVVTLEVTASTTVKMDSGGNYEYSYNTSNIPLGEFTVEAGATKKTVTLSEKGSSPPPTHTGIEIEDLSVYPLVSTVGSEIRVTAMANNTGDQYEESILGFKLDSEPYIEEQVSLEPGETEYMEFSLADLTEGWHMVTAMNSSWSFVVIPVQTEDTASKVFEQLRGVPSELVAEILDSVSPIETSNETAPERRLELAKAVEVIESAVELDLTTPFSSLLLEIEEGEGASLLITVDPYASSALLESMHQTDPRKCASLVEAATRLEIAGMVEILDHVETDLLSQVLLEIARLPSTPSTVTQLLERMSDVRVMAVVQSWIDDGHLRELGLVLDGASEQMLNTVTGNLEKEAQLQVLPELRAEAFALIDTDLLILPDLTFIDLTVNKVGTMKYRVNAHIKNTGNEPSSVEVTLTVDGESAGTFTVDELQAEEERTVEFEWEPDATGAFSLEGAVDGEDEVFEINKHDNTGYLDYIVEESRSWTGVYLVLALLAAVAAGLYWRFR